MIMFELAILSDFIVTTVLQSNLNKYQNEKIKFYSQENRLYKRQIEHTHKW
jgi:hypothetical protein